MIKTTLQAALDQYEDSIGGKFKPDDRFYSKVGVNPKRFGQLLRGEKPIYGHEARSLSLFFKVSLDEMCDNEKPVHYSR